MTHESKLEAVRKAVIAAVPSIMDLKFGCRVNPTRDSVYLVLEDFIGGTSVVEVIDDGEERPIVSTSAKRIEVTKIIGRPIRLADCVQALKKVGYRTTEEWLKTLGLLVDKWLPNEDSLDLQDPPTIQFLYDVLCNQNLK